MKQVRWNQHGTGGQDGAYIQGKTGLVAHPASKSKSSWHEENCVRVLGRWLPQFERLLAVSADS